MSLRYHPSPWLRVIPGDAGSNPGRWIVDDLVRRRRWRLTGRHAKLLLASAGVHTRDELIQAAARMLGNASAESAVNTLIAHEILVATDNDAPEFQTAVTERWTQRGWGKAVEYHLATFDYPCLDYETEGFRADRARMTEYLEAEPEPDRYKKYDDSLIARKLPTPQEACDRISGYSAAGDDQIAGPDLEGACLPIDVVDMAVAMALVAVDSTTLAQTREPLILRTSPSGGGRHPTEGYLLAVDLDGLDPGWYHVRPTGPPCLEQLQARVPPLTEAFPVSVGRSPFPVAALLVLTTRFARNMYRYREARTFRTVHMDAGHIAATARMTAHDLGWVTQLAYADRPDMIEQSLDLHPLAEGYMATVAFGHCRTGM
jgi:SagB-type dehydrogenase family enzyme